MKESDSRYQCDYSALIATDLKNYDQLKHEGIDFFFINAHWILAKWEGEI